MGKYIFKQMESYFIDIYSEFGTILSALELLVAAERRSNHKHQELAAIYGELGQCRRRWQSRTLQMGVMSLVKSGKSTFINALLGDEFLPTSNRPETTHIIRVRHQRTNTIGTLKEGWEIKAHGAMQINSYLRHLNSRTRQADMQITTDSLVLEASLQALGNQSSGMFYVELLDTPGPNEAGKQLESITEFILRELDVVVYILDYTKLNTEYERILLQKLAALWRDYPQHLLEHIYFVVNKIDMQDHYGLTLKQTSRYVAELLCKQFGEFGIDEGHIILMSAEQALLARLVKSGRASAGALRDFARLMQGRRSANLMTLEDWRPDAMELLSASQLPSFEEKVLSSVYQQKERLFLQRLFERLAHCIRGFDNYIVNAGQADASYPKVALIKQLEYLQAGILAMQNRLDSYSMAKKG